MPCTPPAAGPGSGTVPGARGPTGRTEGRGPDPRTRGATPGVAAVVGYSRMPPAELNIPRQVFLAPATRELHPEWAAVAAETVAHLRLDTGPHPDDKQLAGTAAPPVSQGAGRRRSPRGTRSGSGPVTASWRRWRSGSRSVVRVAVSGVGGFPCRHPSMCRTRVKPVLRVRVALVPFSRSPASRPATACRSPRPWRGTPAGPAC
ncbi:hypothetical protein [Streptomyces sp. NBC_00057]|uniref:MmyB family transcriptional regulator n=1 Tax=Streptomyces sp. NBC_00057 TaxID=2975634 RepID=UPI0032506328